MDWLGRSSQGYLDIADRANSIAETCLTWENAIGPFDKHMISFQIHGELLPTSLASLRRTPRYRVPHT
jgi:hypothetical protein